MKIAKRTVALLLSTAATGCGHETGSSDAAAGPGLDGSAIVLGPSPALSDFCDALALLDLEECGCDHPDDQANYFMEKYFCESVRREVTGGRLGYHPDKAQACIDALSTFNHCVLHPGRPPVDTAACADVLVGQTASGRPCLWGSLVETMTASTLVSSCAPGLFCALEPGDLCAGTCRPKAAHGQPCPGIPCGGTATGNCQLTPCADPGDFCNDDGICESIPSQGQACGEPANAYGPCTVGLYCAYPDNAPIRAPGTCQPQATSGACNSGQPFRCGPATYCSLDAAIGSGQCAPILFAQPGQPCGPELPCDCSNQNLCGMDSMCIALAAPGSPCHVDGDLGSTSQQCRGGYCDTTAPIDGGLCRPFLSPGSPCDARAACGIGTCDTDAGVCVPTCYGP